MKYLFCVEVKTHDKAMKSIFSADDARDLRSAWQGIERTLFDLKRAGLIKEYTMEASENTTAVWKERWYI